MNWKLPSKQIVSNKDVEETTDDLLLRHNITMRLTAEAALIEALDHIQDFQDEIDAGVFMPATRHEKYRQFLKQFQ